MGPERVFYWNRSSGIGLKKGCFGVVFANKCGFFDSKFDRDSLNLGSRLAAE
jgi:hypothetical protein